MNIYVDELRGVGLQAAGCFGQRVKFACHLMADTDAELEAMARRIGLKPAWKHGDHYDLSPNKRRLAIAAGAVQVTSRELVKLRQRTKEATQ